MIARDPEALEAQAFGTLAPVTVDDRPLDAGQRLALVRGLLEEGKLPRCARPRRDPAFFYPGLDGAPIHDPDRFPWAAAVRAAVGEFQAELTRLERSGRDRRAFHTVWPEFTTTGEWAALWLRLYGLTYEANAALCPRTLAHVERVPRHGGWLGFSALAPRTHLSPHCGITNAKLRCHVPLELVPGASRIRVDRELHAWRPGEVFVFDDSFEHEAWNDGATRRVVLIFDIFHPDLSDDEVAFLTQLEARTVRRTYNQMMDGYRQRSTDVAWAYDPPAQG